ncbi:MAG: hypothetical protein GEU75_00780 [Dehalococcoidia bacterium]|nr:hypothetical protein [Dehalococcoidia bacterium]
MIVTLLTDFGLSDTYAGVMKGVILARAPEVNVVDLTHDVPPQAVDEAAFLLDGAWRYFPEGSVHVAVVDPGVGTSRRRLAIFSGGHYFVGPDNGVLSAAIPEAIRGFRRPGEGYDARTISLPAGIAAVNIESQMILTQMISATFEGRDVFAPAAAHLAKGGSLSDLGPPVPELLTFPAFRALRVGNRIEGVVLRGDRFGNLITDIAAVDLPPSPVFTVAGRSLHLAASYAAADGPATIVGSSGLIEIAMPNGSAAVVLGAGAGDRVVAA